MRQRGAVAPTQPEAVVYPPPLRPGATVRVIAPAGPFRPELLWRALGWLSERYRVKFDRAMFSRSGYLAGDDSRRLDELQNAIGEKGVAAILCARGGYGATRIAHHIDWLRLRESPRWLAGFSDITAIHNEVAAVGVASLHACNAGALGRSDRRARGDFIQALEAPLTPKRYTLETLKTGYAEGRLFGGNLTLLQSCAAAGRLRVPAGAILFLEDIGEAPYRVDRALTALWVGGHLDDISGVVLGQFSHCRPGPDGTSVRQVFAERFAPRNIPLVAGLPCGHELHNEPMMILRRVTLHARPDGAELCLLVK